MIEHCVGSCENCLLYPANCVADHGLATNQIYNMDCVEGMKMLADGSVDLVVTSPPYDNLRTYNGFAWDFEETAKQLFRVLKPGGVVVWVVGDATIKGSETGTSFRQALHFMDCGFNLHDTMIYAKKAPIPLTHNRYEQQFEYMFVFSKGKPKTFNPIMEDCKSFGKINHMTHRRLSDDLSYASGFGKEVKKQRYKYNIWFFQKENKCSSHPATFPEQLANDHIISWSNPGDVVLDPFMGSGTTAKMAIETNRNFIGFEISAEYCEIARIRIGQPLPVGTQPERMAAAAY